MNSISFMRTVKGANGSRKENAGCTNDPISARRKTVFINPSTKPSASISGRRQTMFINAANVPTKMSKISTTSASTSTSTNSSGNKKKSLPSLQKLKKDALKSSGYRLATPTFPVRTNVERSFISNTKWKVTDDSSTLKSKNSASSHQERKSSLHQVQHSTPSRHGIFSSANQRESFPHSSDPSSKRHDSSSKRHDSSSKQHDDSSSHRRDSSSHRRDSSSRPRDSSSRPRDSSSRPRDSSSRPRDSSSHPRDSSHRSVSSSNRYSTSSDNSVNRSTSVQKDKATKRPSSNYGKRPNCKEKKRRLTEDTRGTSTVETTVPLKPVKKPSAAMNILSNLEKRSKGDESRKQYKLIATTEASADKTKSICFVRPNDSKRIESATIQVSTRKDAGWNPVVEINRLKVDSLKKHGETTKLKIHSDDNYIVYRVDGKIKIKNKKEDRRKSETERQQKCQPVGETNDEVILTQPETRNFSQQTERRSLTRDIGVQKNDEEAIKQMKTHKENINLFTQSVKEYDAAVREQAEKIDSLEQTVTERNKTIRERQGMIQERDLQITEREQMIAERNSKIAERDEKIREYEEKLKLQESSINAMLLQIESLKAWNENLSKHLKGKDANLKDIPDKPAPAVEASNTNGTIQPLRVRNIDELRDIRTSTTPAASNSQNSHTMNAVNPTNVERNPISPAGERFSRFPNNTGWTTGTATQNAPQLLIQQSSAYSQSTEYLGMVTPSVSYMHNVQHSTQPTTSATAASYVHNVQRSTQPMISATAASYVHNVQQTTQPTTSATLPMTSPANGYVQPMPSTSNGYGLQPMTPAANGYSAQSAIPKTSVIGNAIPHQNLPRIIQRSAQERAFMSRPSNQINSVSFDRVSANIQDSSNQQTRPISQIRSRAKTSYFGYDRSSYLQQGLLPHQVFRLQQPGQQTPSQSSYMHHCGR